MGSFMLEMDTSFFFLQRRNKITMMLQVCLLGCFLCSYFGIVLVLCSHFLTKADQALKEATVVLEFEN